MMGLWFPICLRHYVLADNEVGIPNIGAIKVVASDSFHVVEKTITFDVLGNLVLKSNECNIIKFIISQMYNWSYYK